MDKKLIKKAKQETIRYLEALGIDEPFIVRERDFKLRFPKQDSAKDWLALYRSNSQFGIMPIFWVNSRLPEHTNPLLDGSVFCVLYETFLHEFGHVIWECLRIHNKLDKILKGDYDTSWGSSDEELFAEDFKDYALAPNNFPMSWVIKDAVVEYRQIAFE